MDEAKAEILQQVLDAYIRSKIDDDPDEDHPDILTILWEKLRKSHSLRVVK